MDTGACRSTAENCESGVYGMAKTGQTKKLLLQYSVITLGCALYALGFNWCFEPNHLSVGGFTGIAQIIHFLIPQLPIGVLVVVLNLPLFVLSWKRTGKTWLIPTLYATVVSSLMIDGLLQFHQFRPMEPMLAALYGGVTVGVSCGLLMRQNATTGGTELAARLLKLRFSGLSIGTLCMTIDCIVVVAYAAVFRDLTQALYAVVALYIISKAMDQVVYGGNRAKMAFIISQHYVRITDQLLALDRGVTLLDGRGGFSGKEKQVILCAFSRGQVMTVKSIVKEADPDAFIIVCDAHEILGEGFGVNTPDGL